MRFQANPIFTIGYATLGIERFIDLLLRHTIEAVADVRSQPYSRHTPEYSQARLKAALKEAGISYIFMGKELGARREETECYVDGKVRYDLVAGTQAFQEGISRLEKGRNKVRIALLCAEKDPLTCHRSILISRHLSRMGIKVQHILHDGTLESQEELDQKLLQIHSRDQADLFEDESARLEQVYGKQKEQISYVHYNPWR